MSLPLLPLDVHDAGSSSELSIAALEQLVSSVVAGIDGAAHACVVMSADRSLLVMASTDRRIDDALQHEEGPPGRAAGTGWIARIPSTRRCTEFPEYATACERFGLHSVGAFPIVRSARTTIGVLVVTSYDHHGFGTADLRTARTAATRAAALLEDLVDLRAI